MPDEGYPEVGIRMLETIVTLRAGAAVPWGWRGNEYQAKGTAGCFPGAEDTPSVGIFWDEVVKPIVEDHAEEVWRACGGALKRQDEITRAGSGENAFNTWVYLRSAIEEHEQDSMDDRSLMGVIVDGARNAMEAVGAKDGAKAQWERYVAEATASKSPLMRRIAIHGVTESTHWTAEQKLTWWADQKVCHEYDLRHEAYRLVGTTWSEGSAKAKAAATEAILSMKPSKQTPIQEGTEEEHAHEEELRTGYDERARYELIAWLQDEKQAELTEGLKAERAKIQQKHPEWIPRDHADFTHWTTGAHWIEPKAPDGWSAEALIQRWEEKGR